MRKVYLLYPDTMSDQKEYLQTLMRDVLEIFTKLNKLETIPRHFGTDDLLYPGEIHTIEMIGSRPDITATEISLTLDVTKGAVSQMIARLERKKLITRTRRQRTMDLALTEKGGSAYAAHRAMHARLEGRIRSVIGDLSEQQYRRVQSVFAGVGEIIDEYLQHDRS